MKSSSAVFTRQNPFPPESHVVRTHYNPSRAKKIPKPQKKLALSPVRFSNLTSSAEAPPQTSSLSPKDPHFLEGSHCDVFGSSFVKEIWPSDDLGSPYSVDGSICPESQASQPQHSVTIAARRTQEPSVLAKYVERFRYGRPQSREERQQSTADGVDGQMFRWMSSSPPSSSTPTQRSVERLRGALGSRNDDKGSIQSPDGLPRSCPLLSTTNGLPDLSVLALSETSHCEPGESEALRLQERASRLLHKSEHSLSSGSIPISSEGLGCSDFSSPVTADEPIRRPIMPSFMDSGGHKSLLTMPKLSGGSPLSHPPALGTEGARVRPEDDILFQWRLRRKMEQARDCSQTSSHSSLLHQPVLNRLQEQKTHPSPVSADLARRTSLSFTAAPEETSRSLSTLAAQEPALPASKAYAPKPCAEACVRTCVRTCHSSDTYSQTVTNPEPIDERVTGCSVPRPHTRGQRSSLESSAKPCSKQYSPCSLPPQRSESTEGEGLGLQKGGEVEGKGVPQVKRGWRKTAPSIQKKTADKHVGGHGGIQKSQHNTKANRKHARGQEGVRKTKEPGHKNECHSIGQSSSGDVCSGDLAPLPSPIRNTLGQVVSEVLFPGPDFPAQPRTSSSFPSYSPQGPSQCPALPRQSLPQPCDVIGELMQEAQDSDGLEFEDDPLLLVLRQQRKWVKEQICDVDMILDELHED